MIKKITALIAAGIFFLTSQGLAWAEKNLPEESETNSVEKPFATPEEDIKHPPLEAGYYDPPVYEKGQEPPQTIEPPPVDDGEGLEFLVYHQNGMMAFAVIADHEKYQLRPVLARNQIPGRATVSQMNSPDAIATINASYFAVNGVILGNTKIDGVTAGTTYFIRSAIGIREDGSTIFARQSYRGVLQFNGEEVVVDGVNCERNGNTVVVYNSW